MSVEVIVVDDASVTAPTDELDRLLGDPRVALVRVREPRGVMAAANLGVREAGCGWLAFLDDRDLWAPDHLATVGAACEEASADFGYSAAWLVDDRRRIRGFRSAPAPTGLARALLEDNVIGRSTVVFRRDLWHRAGGYDEWLSALGHWDLWLRWSRIGRACMVPTATVATHQDSRPAAEIARELRELARRYGGDARRARVRFGRGATDAALAAAAAPPLEAQPPWLIRESPSETV